MPDDSAAEQLDALGVTGPLSRGWREALHPRDRQGEWAGKGGGAAKPGGGAKLAEEMKGLDDKAVQAELRSPDAARRKAAAAEWDKRGKAYREKNRIPTGAGPVTHGDSTAFTDYTKRSDPWTAEQMAALGLHPGGQAVPEPKPDTRPAREPLTAGWVQVDSPANRPLDQKTVKGWDARGGEVTGRFDYAAEQVRPPGSVSPVQVRYVWHNGQPVIVERALSRAGTNPEPLGKPGGPGLFGVKGLGLPVMIQHVRNDLMGKRGMAESEATQVAIGVVRNWAHGHDGKGNDVHPATVAQASAAVAEYDRDRAKAKATRSTTMADQYDADGLDGSWDSTDDLPDLSGVDVATLDDAAEGDPEHAGWAGAGDVSRAAKLGSGGRFAALKAGLAGKGVKDPGALAAKIGRAKYGKGKFAKLAAKAKGGGKPAPAMASRAVAAGEIFRFFPLEECRIMRGSEGREYGSGRVVEAYAAVFDQDAEIRDHEGHYVENIDPGAFTDVLRMIAPERNGGYWNATCLYNHGMTIHGTPAERFSLPAGVPKHIASEGQGLLTRTEYAATPLGDELLTLVEMGALRTQSFTGAIMRSTPPLRGPGDRYRARGGVLERVKRMMLGLREYGLTPFAAYSGAEVLGVRMQLPGAFTDVDDLDSTEFEEPDPDEGDGTGIPPEDGSATRSTGNRLYQLRTQELLAEHGIILDD